MKHLKNVEGRCENEDENNCLNTDNSDKNLCLMFYLFSFHI